MVWRMISRVPDSLTHITRRSSPASALAGGVRRRVSQFCPLGKVCRRFFLDVALHRHPS